MSASDPADPGERKTALEVLKLEADIKKAASHLLKAELEIRELRWWIFRPVVLQPLATILLATITGIIGIGNGWFSTKLESLSNKQAEVQRQIDKLTSTRSDLNEQIARLQKERNNLQTQRDSSLAQILNLRRRSEDLGKQLDTIGPVTSNFGRYARDPNTLPSWVHFIPNSPDTLRFLGKGQSSSLANASVASLNVAIAKAAGYLSERIHARSSFLLMFLREFAAIDDRAYTIGTQEPRYTSYTLIRIPSEILSMDLKAYGERSQEAIVSPPRAGSETPSPLNGTWLLDPSLSTISTFQDHILGETQFLGDELTISRRGSAISISWRDSINNKLIIKGNYQLPCDGNLQLAVGRLEGTGSASPDRYPPGQMTDTAAVFIRSDA